MEIKQDKESIFALGRLSRRYSMKCRSLCILFAAAILLGVCGQAAAQQADKRAPAPHKGKSADEIANAWGRNTWGRS